jgi:hypothetical protein
MVKEACLLICYLAMDVGSRGNVFTESLPSNEYTRLKMFQIVEPGELSRYIPTVDGFDSCQGQVIFLYSTDSRLVLGPTQLPIQWVPAALSPGVKRPGCEANHLPSSRAEVKNGGVISPPLPYVFMAWCLIN